ncbi:MAG TPA: M48 family metalloprotease [Allosphingosinicella sp.]|jgi:heat shock protein HtpX
MAQHNGLFGWVEHNDRRSVELFAAFIAAFHLVALPTLLIFLALFDRAHAPFFNWTGYALRYVPLLTLFGVIAFAIGGWAHLRAVRGALPFTTTDPRSAPRLWRIFEPLAITAGLPKTRLAILESQALNAFAYGFAKREATIVVTRALIDALDDDELEAVLAHELTHIRRGDVRYLVVANACLYAIRSLAQVEIDKQQRQSLRRNTIFQSLVEKGILTHDQAITARDFLGGFALVILLPFVIIVLLAVLLARQQVLNLGDAIRLTILSSREYVADAGSVELTKNPAALVSALGRIDGRGRLPGLSPEFSAMLIDSERRFDGPTHPSVGQRVAAIASLTGSMAFIAPSRRDTRPGAARDFGRRRSIAVEVPESSPVTPSTSLWQGFIRVAGERGGDVFGMARPFGWGLVAALPAFILFNAHQIDRPDELLSAFDPRGGAAFAELAGMPIACPKVAPDPSRPCSEITSAQLGRYSEQRNMLGMTARMAGGRPTAGRLAPDSRH